MGVERRAIHRLPAFREVPGLHPRLPRAPRAPHIPHVKALVAAVTLAIAGTAATATLNRDSSVKPENTGNIGPGGLKLERENYPMGNPLTLNLDSDGKLIVRLETGKPNVWAWRSYSGLLDEQRNWLTVLGPKYASESPYGLGSVIIVMGEPKNNPDIIFGGVWLKRVNRDGIPVGEDGQVLSPEETPIYSKADSINLIIPQAPKEPMVGLAAR